MTNKDNTTVNEVDINLDELLGTPGAENITVPQTKTEQKPNLFSRKENVDLSFLDNNDDDDDENTSDTSSKAEDEGNASTSGETNKPKEKISKEEFESILDDGSEESTETTKKGGRHNGLVELTNKLIEKGLLTPFEGEEDVTKYNLKDFEDLADF